LPFLKTWRSLLVDALRDPASRGGALRRLEVRYLGRFSKTSFATGSAEKALGQPT
jgi:hypothetical protein